MSIVRESQEIVRNLESEPVYGSIIIQTPEETSVMREEDADCNFASIIMGDRSKSIDVIIE